MNTTSLLLRGLAPASLVSMALLAGCAGKPAPDELRTATDSAGVNRRPPTGSIRFAIELGRDTEGPVYVTLNSADGQAGWVHAFRDGERIYFTERCEIEDCGVPPVVCGAALSFVRDLANDPNLAVELVWDGITSVVDSLSGCETRQPAPPGDYVARFCYSDEAEFDGTGDPTRAVLGRAVRPTCIEKLFTLDDHQVVLRI